MSYKALYRKYRPQNFGEVSAQEHITRTLKNALVQDRISHAYLFSGPRGIGKTSIARIFAKAINCLNSHDGEPCNECEVCTGISNYSVSDIIEIDAASNTGVDDIRNLKEGVRYLPSVCKYKVYIIDEVHMLSTNAFNALLKTLEEPPKHVIFILCTTETQKVPATIQSRCQRFDFHLISSEDIVKRTTEICQLENINTEDGVLELIAEISEGGMRDALSLLDQAESFSSDSLVTIDDVLQISGKLSNDTLINIANSIYEYDSLKAVTLLDSLIKIGKEVPKILNGLIVFYKDILVIKNVKIELNKVGYKSESFQELTKKLNNETIYNYITILTEALNDMKYSQNQKLYLELAFIKMSTRPDGSQVFIDRKPVETISVIKEENKEQVKETTVTNESEAKTNEKNVEKKVESSPSETIEVKTDDSKKKETKIESKEENTKNEQPEVGYDIHFIEQTLFNASKEYKETVIEKMPEIFVKTKQTPNHKFAIMIKPAQVMAASKTNKSIIFSFEDVGYCNLVMKKENKEPIRKMLNEFFGTPLDFIALPVELWVTISGEFVKLFRENVRTGKKDFIKLTYVPFEGLRTLEQKNVDYNEERHKNIKSLFGEELKVVEKKDEQKWFWSNW